MSWCNGLFSLQDCPLLPPQAARYVLLIQVSQLAMFYPSSQFCSLLLLFLVKSLLTHSSAGCAALGISGLCCPTPDGSMLACCDSLAGGESRMQDEWKSLIYIDHAGSCPSSCIVYVDLYLYLYLDMLSYLLTH